ncbi:aldo/keto reductase [Streptomyces sp. NPDC004284]|uniref:aldo/keto reductase n=1 Tax=Streptomyces sp. NPDC004284 TaxID=3364695 RepID=UPI0036C0FAB7
MNMRFLGRTGLQVSELSFGAMTFGTGGGYGHMGGLDADGARALVEQCLDSGVNFFDTSDVYAAGESERILGAAVRGRRDEIVLATKARWPLEGAGPNDQGLSRHHLIRAVEASLRRLDTDHLDLYQIHGWDGRTPWEETLRALDDLVRAGKVRYLGASNLAAWQLTRAVGLSEQHFLERFAVHQIQYNLLNREAEWELIPMARNLGVGITCWSPLAGGLLSGHQQPGTTPPPGSRRSTGYFEPQDMQWAFKVVDAVRKVAADRGATPAQVAIRWLLDQPGVTSVILGARNSRQLAENLDVTGWSLSDQERARLDLVSHRPLPYPYWHQAFTDADRAGSADSED